MTNLLPSSSQPVATRKELPSAYGARAVALFVLVEGASVIMTLMTDVSHFTFSHVWGEV